MARSNRNSKKTKTINILISPFLIFFITISIFSLKYNSNFAQAADIDDLRSKINEKSREIQEVEKQIRHYQTELVEIGKEANTLQNAIKSLDVTQDKLETDISLTRNKMDSENLNLDRLAIEIDENQEKIGRNSETLGETLRILNETGQSSMVEALLKYDDIASFWDEVDNLQRFQSGIKEHLDNLKAIKEVLEDQKEETEKRKDDLEQLKVELDAQNKIVEVNKQQKSSLLKETKNTEAEYEKILQRNLERKAQFEKELFEFESQLRIAIDPSSIPGARSGILSWPLRDVFVTQYFGKTVDSQRLYTSGTHNGVDFRAAMGTPVRAALSGVISHLGNTDEVSGCYSFGRWVLVKHNNGLSTLYTHLSSINVSQGQAVNTGDTIAFSGGLPGTYGAGYSTGPHLHFGVYATEGLRPQVYQSSTPCNGAYIPLADQKAYLDPMSYLPPL